MTLANESFDVVSLDERWYRLYRVSWYVAMVFTLAIFISALPGYLLMLPAGPHVGAMVVTDLNITIGFSILYVVISLSSVILSLVLAWLIFRQRSMDRMAVYLSFFLLVYAVGFAGPMEIVGRYYVELLGIGSFVFVYLLLGPLTVGLIVMFPDGRLVPRWSRWVVLASLPIGAIAYYYDFALGSPPFDLFLWLATIYTFGVLAAAFVAQVQRYRRVSNQQERQQIKWVAYGVGIWFGLMLVSTVPYLQIQAIPAGTTMPWWIPVMSLVWALSLIALPVSLTVAITRYRLYDIDIIINRTVVYAVLTVVVVVLYVLIVGSLSAFFQSSGNLIISLLGTGIVAVIFNPLRQRLQRAANQMMFGDRDEPYEVIRRLGRLLESSAAPEIVLPSIVETIAKTLKLPHAEITVKRNGDYATAAVYGRAAGNSVEFPLSYQSEIIGQLLVSPRSQNESLSSADEGLLRQIARQAGPAVQAIQLTEDLQTSRIRLVTAREEERRRLRRDLHDGLGPVLASQGLKMAAASQLLRDDPDMARQLLDDLAAQNESTVAEIRRLVYDLRPAALDDLGLVGAIREYAVGISSLDVEVIQPEDGLPQLPAAIEVAAYRIATEALTNVTRHAQARRCTVNLLLENEINGKTFCIEISDDGRGLLEDRRPGVGLTSMRERAEEVGGRFEIESSSKGTRVMAHLPLVE